MVMGWQIARIGCCIVVGLGLAGCQSSDKTLTDVVASYGFSRNIPPNTLYGPGSLVNLIRYDPADRRLAEVQLGYLCTDRYSVALYPNPPSSSETEQQGISSPRGGSVSLDIPALQKLFNINLSASAAGSVVATIADTKILAYAPDELAEIRGLLRSKCRSLVRDNIRTGNAWQVEQVLQATVDLTVTLKAGASAGVKAEAGRQLVNAGFNAEAGETFTSKGKSLYYGVKLRPLTGL